MRKLLKFVFILFLGVICCACVNSVAVHELNTKAVKYIEDGDIETAISRLEASVDLDGNIYESRYNLANAYLQVGKNKKALEQIEAALDLIKNEPTVYYTHGVAAVKVADDIYEVKDDKGELVEVKLDTEADKIQAAKDYVALLNKANKSFDEYIKIASNGDDTQEVLNLINENNDKIAQKRAEFDLENIE